MAGNQTPDESVMKEETAELRECLEEDDDAQLDGRR